jgi:DNA end-binding protein Ku
MAGMRALCSAVVSFGLVSVPVKAYLTASPEKVSFNRISPKGNRTKQKVVDAATGEEITITECIAGYEVAKDQYITFTDDELDALASEKSNVIEMLEITDKVSLSPAHVERALYLAPDKGADKSYKLLNRCLKDEGKVAIAKHYARGKDHLVAIAPVGELLMMFQLFYQNELRELGTNFAKNSDPSDKEIALGKLLMAQLTTDDFDFGKYKDEYLAKVEVAVEKKKNGEKIESVKQEVNAMAFDLAALLEQSMKKKG